jgi:hypothetical protein
MLKRFMNKKVVAIGLTAGLTLGVAGAAFAYFSGSGAGTGAADTGSVTTTDLAISSSTPTGLLPGGPAGTINLTIKNNGSGAEHVGTVTGTVSGVTSGSIVGDETCATSFYTVAPVNVDKDIAAGTTYSLATTTITMGDDGNNQDNCQDPNGVVSIDWAS